ncbi:acyl-CoA dehydrogenase family protein [Tropicibacter sp. R16_0]|uniref:acyl-CoA dehydrogenase family protein n=1 Tax=Tropicibacter sp. R16_0 TaxID=2821102 RepID=UPI001AD9930B|nr:acyl-CoA dehydrogenase family protein [Tropicibacter sp. R16_0]MBO9448958.1 acyl-CoA dehydrogenase family protein [Tropicibacter sp. R16_0]
MNQGLNRATTGLEAGKFAELRSKVNDLLYNEMLPFEKENELSHETRFERAQLEEWWKRSRDLGIYGCNLPEEFGGLGLSIDQLCTLKEDATRSNAALYGCVLGENGGPMRIGYIITQATAEQNEEFFYPAARGERAGCFALSEPNAGSDASRIQTTAVKDGDDYIINGHKRYITASRTADFAIVMCVTDPDAGYDGVTAFLVDAKSPGYRIEGHYLPMSGQHIDNDIILENVRVPARNILGGLGRGFKLGMERININRLLQCPTMLGHAQFALEQAVDYSNRRVQFKQPIANFQAIQHMLADMKTANFAAHSMIHAAAAKADRGENIRTEASMCKVFVAENAFQVADKAIQIHGATGMTKNHPVEWVFRRLRMFRVLTGSSEIQRNTIGKGIQKAWQKANPEAAQ